ncbi:MAG TPA: hypothetical protein VH108_12705 [Gaiellaceae bacterium]|nr:hypothetical protein [Gaiellaceae bacterium]
MLWVLAALIAAGLTGAWLIPRNTPHKSVAQYINRANATGTAFAKQYQDVGNAYRSLTLAPQAQAAQAARLRLSAHRLTQLRVDLQQIPAPPAARVLRRRLLAFYRRQEQVAYELAGIMAYFPKLIASERPLAPAAASLRASLAKSKTPKAQAAILGVYGVAIAASRDRIAGIHAPALLAPAQAAEVRRLLATEQSIREVQHALLSHNREQLQRGLTKLRDTGSGASAATRVAILAYNRHVGEIRLLGAKVERERQRLDNTLN